MEIMKYLEPLIPYGEEDYAYYPIEYKDKKYFLYNAYHRVLPLNLYSLLSDADTGEHLILSCGDVHKPFSKYIDKGAFCLYYRLLNSLNIVYDEFLYEFYFAALEEVEEKTKFPDKVLPPGNDIEFYAEGISNYFNNVSRKMTVVIKNFVPYFMAYVVREVNEKLKKITKDKASYNLINRLSDVERHGPSPCHGPLAMNLKKLLNEKYDR